MDRRDDNYVTPGFLRRMGEDQERWRMLMRSYRERRERRMKRLVLVVVLLSLLVVIWAAQQPMTTVLAVGLRVIEGGVLAIAIILIWAVVRVADEAAKRRRGR